MRLSPGATIGIVGGGQLGRMLALAALDLGFRIHVFAPPEADNVAFAAAHSTTEASYDDAAALSAFLREVDVVTFEFENIPVAALTDLSGEVYPPLKALAVSQDRLVEKSFLRSCGLPVARHFAVDSLRDLQSARSEVPDGILKTRRFGYDGKGQARIGPHTDGEAAFTSLGGQYLIFEERIGFAAETSVILVRGRGGGIKTYPTTSNAHENGILRQTSFPSPLSGPLEQAAFAHAAALADALDYVGVLAVEFFVTSGAEPSLIANEMAPRVHNTGHWTMDGAVTSQFENHIRAIAGWPLGSVVLVGNVTMRNLLGDEALKCDEHLLTAGAKLHLYGKAAPKPGRKMGHVNFIV